MARLLLRVIRFIPTTQKPYRLSSPLPALVLSSATSSAPSPIFRLFSPVPSLLPAFPIRHYANLHPPPADDEKKITNAEGTKTEGPNPLSAKQPETEAKDSQAARSVFESEVSNPNALENPGKPKAHEIEVFANSLRNVKQLADELPSVYFRATLYRRVLLPPLNLILRFFKCNELVMKPELSEEMVKAVEDELKDHRKAVAHELDVHRNAVENELSHHRDEMILQRKLMEEFLQVSLILLQTIQPSTNQPPSSDEIVRVIKIMEAMLEFQKNQSTTTDHPTHPT